MFEIRYATETDKPFWFTLDEHFNECEFDLKIRDKRVYIISIEGKPIGVMRYNLMWDNTPFLTLIYIDDAHHGKGYGKQAMFFSGVVSLWSVGIGAILLTVVCIPGIAYLVVKYKSIYYKYKK